MPDTDETNRSLGELEEHLSELRSAADMLDDARLAVETNAEETKSSVIGLINHSKEASANLTSESEKFNETATNLLRELQNYGEAATTLLRELDALTDRLDTSITGINTSIQNIFGRFDTVERNLKDEIRGSKRLHTALIVAVIIISGAALVFLILM